MRSARSAAGALELVSRDMAGWIAGPIAERCPPAKRCVDPFQTVALATEALDKVRREVWNQAQGQGGPVPPSSGGARFALWKNPENLTARQQSKLADVERMNRPLYRTHLLKEQLRQIYRLPAPPGDHPAGGMALSGLGSLAGGTWSSSPARSPSSGRGSSPRSATASPTPGWRRSTPRSA